jgi:5-methylcytosine-specific restriction endonuclease McrA
MARDKDNYNKWFREYYKTHKAQYIRKAEEHQKKKKIWFENKFKEILFCSRCGEKDRRCLDFHHLDPSKKDDSIAHMIKTASYARLEAEVKKCIVLCANCHRKEHVSLM